MSEELGSKSIFKIHFIDIGEGDAALLEAEDQTILIDAGNLMSWKKILDIHQRINKKYNTLILTHPHLDHIGGVFGLIQFIKYDKFYDNNEKIDNSDVTYRWYSEIVRKNSNYKSLHYPDEIAFKKFTLKVLSPSAQKLSDWNSNSLVLLLESKNFKCLFMADGLRETEEFLMNQDFFKKLLPVTVLKAGHHASKHTGSDKFINAIKPETTVISVNKNNYNGYPDDEVIKKYQKENSRIYRTDNDGSIIIDVNDDGSYSVNAKKVPE